jgi:hypothetical protein
MLLRMLRNVVQETVSSFILILKLLKFSRIYNSSVNEIRQSRVHTHSSSSFPIPRGQFSLMTEVF